MLININKQINLYMELLFGSSMLALLVFSIISNYLEVSAHKILLM